MPYDITFKNTPAGFAVQSAKGPGNILVCVREFISSEDGDKLISRLDGISANILAGLPVLIPPSQIDHMLAIIRPNGTGTVYINELKIFQQIMPRRDLKAGELVFARDILDMQRIQIQEVEIPTTAGIILIFSSGWRKALFYDLVPLSPEKPLRTEDLELLFGQYWSYLTFQDIFKISENTWDELFKQKWFPFIHLGHSLIKKIVEYAKAGWNIDDLLPEIQKELSLILDRNSDSWKNNPYFKDHIPFIERSLEHYKAGDHLSVSSILYPRIEGVMRTYFTAASPGIEPSAKTLTREVIQKDSEERHNYSLFLPDKFHEYLDNVYFAHFTPGSNPDVARHAVAHGEARAEAFDAKSSIIALLILHQLALFLSSPAPTKQETQAPAPPPHSK